MAVREVELVGGSACARRGVDDDRVDHHARQSRPYAPAFMRTPPPAVPGIAEANSKPPRPASRARCRQTAFGAPPPATSTSPRRAPRRARPPSRSTSASTPSSATSRFEPSPIVSTASLVARPTRAARPARRASRAREEARRPAGADRRVARERRRARPSHAPSTRDGPTARSTSPAPTTSSDVAGPARRRSRSAPSRPSVSTPRAPRGPESVDDELPAHAGHRLLARVDLRHRDVVGRRERRCELAGEVPRA